MNTPQTIQEGICVLVDGGCLNNNKPVSERKMYGSMTVFYNGKQVESTIEFFAEPYYRETKCIHKYNLMDRGEHASNNMAEVVMIRTALEYVLNLILRQEQQQNPRKLDAITVMSDSEWALNVVTGAYKIKAQNEIAYDNELTTINYIKAMLEKRNITLIFQHVDNVWVKSVLGH